MTEWKMIKLQDLGRVEGTNLLNNNDIRIAANKTQQLDSSENGKTKPNSQLADRESKLYSNCIEEVETENTINRYRKDFGGIGTETRPQVICKYFSRNKCVFGDGCRFSHEMCERSRTNSNLGTSAFEMNTAGKENSNPKSQIHENHQVNQIDSPILCKFYPKCSAGNSCCFLHDSRVVKAPKSLLSRIEPVMSDKRNRETHELIPITEGNSKASKIISKNSATKIARSMGVDVKFHRKENIS